MERLEPRLFFSTSHQIHPSKSGATTAASAAAATVLLERADGSPAPLVADRTTWIVIHGSGGSAAGVSDLATAVDASSPDDQVLVVDWSQLAATPDLGVAVDNTRIVADTLAAKFAKLGLPARRLNLIGFSLGALVAGRLATDLHARGGVNRIIALDPAAPSVSSGGHSYHPPLNLAADSSYAIAFHAGSTTAANASADATVLLENVGTAFETRHQNVYNLFTAMTRANASGAPDAVSRVFSIERILDGALPAWRTNSYSDTYEAVLTAGTRGGLSPSTLQYHTNKFKHTVTVFA